MAWEDDVFIQRNGIVFFLHFYNRILETHLQGTSIVKIFRYVDDYLTILRCESKDISLHVTSCQRILWIPWTAWGNLQDAARFLYLYPRLLLFRFSYLLGIWATEHEITPPYLSASSKLLRRGTIRWYSTMLCWNPAHIILKLYSVLSALAFS